MKRQRDETISIFTRRFPGFYYNMPKEIQPPEVVARLIYATIFHLNMLFLLMERRLVTLQQMLNDSK
jgi:hypothetical protein